VRTGERTSLPLEAAFFLSGDILIAAPEKAKLSKLSRPLRGVEIRTKERHDPNLFRWYLPIKVETLLCCPDYSKIL